jgi:hypothetical protein
VKQPAATERGSPRIGRPHKPGAPVIGLRLSEALLERLAAYAEVHGITRSVAIRRLISQGLDRD